MAVSVAVGPSFVQSGCPGSSSIAVSSSWPASSVAVSSVHANSVGFVSTPPCRMSSFASGSVSPGSIAAPSVRSVWSGSVPNRPVSSFAQPLRRVASPVVWPRPVLNSSVSSFAQPFVLPRVIVGPSAASLFCRLASGFPLVLVVCLVVIAVPDCFLRCLVSPCRYRLFCVEDCLVLVVVWFRFVLVYFGDEPILIG